MGCHCSQGDSTTFADMFWSVSGWHNCLLIHSHQILWEKVEWSPRVRLGVGGVALHAAAQSAPLASKATEIWKTPRRYRDVCSAATMIWGEKNFSTTQFLHGNLIQLKNNHRRFWRKDTCGAKLSTIRLHCGDAHTFLHVFHMVLLHKMFRSEWTRNLRLFFSSKAHIYDANQIK